MLNERFGPHAGRMLQRRLAQRKAAQAQRPGDLQAAAEQGISGAAGPLPHRDAIERSFGRHEVAHVKAHTDGAAAKGAAAMGAQAFALGDHVAFDGAPSLHTAAHEAAHVVQQRGGVQLEGGVGAAGDAYEQNADQVADQVVRSESAVALLDQHAGGAAATTPAVQRKLIDNASGEEVDWFDLDRLTYEQAVQLNHMVNEMRLWSADPDDVAKIAAALKHGPTAREKGSTSEPSSSRETSGKETASASGTGKKEKEAPPKRKEITYGLVHGGHNWDDNTVDLHVAPPPTGSKLSLTAQDMLDAALESQALMLGRQKSGGPPGRFVLHPQGAVVVKTVVELLGEALGGTYSKWRARYLKQQRRRGAASGGKKGAMDKQAEKLDPSVLPEHFAYLDSLRGDDTVSIVPSILAMDDKYRPVSREDAAKVSSMEKGPKQDAEFEKLKARQQQDMMVTTDRGNEMYAKYKGVLEDEDEPAGPALDVTLSVDQLPKIIALLRSQVS